MSTACYDCGVPQFVIEALTTCADSGDPRAHGPASDALESLGFKYVHYKDPNKSRWTYTPKPHHYNQGNHS